MLKTLHMTLASSPAPHPHAPLSRTIGRWSLAALMVNSIIGSGIFGLPSIIARQVGASAVFAWVAAALFNAVIIGCFAELASRFTEPGGPYLYARVAFGPLIGIWTGWLAWAVRLASSAAAANLFVIYLGELWPGAQELAARVAILTLLIGFVAVINYRGVRGGTQLSNLFTVAKLLPLGVLIVGGAAYILMTGRHVAIGVAHVAPRSWFDALLLLVFAYGGFEGALLPAGEIKDPRRDAPFALGVGLLTCAVIYVSIQAVVMGLLPDPASSQRPLSATAQIFMGPAGGLFMALGALISVYGYEASMLLNTPRLTFALAEQGDFPRLFASVHPKFRTPHVSIVIFALLLWLLAVSGTFQWNATLSAIGRIFYYAIVCAAVPVLRRRDPAGARFRVPGGSITATLGIVLSLALLFGIHLQSFLVLACVFALAFVNWVWVRNRGGSPAV
jgi:basic amino acid/polyamine antiporter, APA family